jgi:O-acetyl-ADP-ribose deacetylase (regulator of RNase III)
MRQVTGDLFTYPCDAVVIAINWTTKKNGEAVMGAGVALEAAKRWPWLPGSLGNLIRMSPDRPTLSGVWVTEAGGLVCLPTKRDWREPADMSLIETGAHCLAETADRLEWETVALPRLGCGLRTGQLRWEDVEAILAPILDDRFVVVTPEPLP